MPYRARPKGPPIQFYSALRDLFFGKIFSPNGPPFKFFWTKMLTISEVSPFSAPLGPFFAFSIFEYCKLTLGSPFAIFEPWIWRRLGPVPAC